MASEKSDAVCGVLAQLGERKVRNLEARGSIPLCSTKTKKPRDERGFFRVRRT